MEERIREKFNKLLFENRICFPEYPVKGSYPYLEFGALLLRNIKNYIEKLLEETGHKEVCFPVLIPLSLFKKESEFFEGFSPEAYVVRETLKGKEFEEPLILRPTSEVPMYYTYSFIIRSYKELPIKIYQTVNIFRCETKMTGPLLRLREVSYFNEAHTFHSSREDAEKQIKEALEIYKKILDHFNLPYIVVEVPEWEKFSGSEYTYDLYVILPDGKLLEYASIIYLGQKFSKVYDLQFLNKENKKEYVYQTCYGIGIERILGSILMLGMDDIGFFIPPEVIGKNIVVVPIFKPENKEKILSYCEEVKNILENIGYNVEIDLEDETPGAKFYKWEKRGYPLRIEIGEKEVNERKITISLRSKKKYQIEIEKLQNSINSYEKEVSEDFKKIVYEKVTKLLNKYCKIIDLEDVSKESIENIENELQMKYVGKIIECPFNKSIEGKHLFGRKW